MRFARCTWYYRLFTWFSKNFQSDQLSISDYFNNKNRLVHLLKNVKLKLNLDEDTAMAAMALPKFFGKLDFELVVGLSGPTYDHTFPGIFKVPDPPAPAWCHAQIWPPKMIISENWPKPGLRVLYG